MTVLWGTDDPVAIEPMADRVVLAHPGKLRVIASIEEPWLIAKILGHVRVRDEHTTSAARAPPPLAAEQFKRV